MTRATAERSVAPAALASVLALLPPSGAAAPSAPAVVVNSLGMRMVLVKAGRFTMGSAPGTPMRQPEEISRRVTLTRAFRLAATEVTQAQWASLMGTSAGGAASGGPAGADRGEAPVASLSWIEAQEFCRRLSSREGLAYRLPTEAEWEYACRAGSDDAASPPPLADVAWYAEDSGGRAQPAGRKQANAWGFQDLLGNVAEWTRDAYAPYPGVAEEADPRGPDEGVTRVVRGGSWRSFAPALRCAARAGVPESYQLAHVGLRVAREP